MALDALETKAPPHPADGRRRRRHSAAAAEDEYLALCLVMLARGGAGGGDGSDRRGPSPPPPASDHKQQSHECSVCGKVFGSYQALGGHKTSHRKPISSSSAAAAAADDGGGGGGELGRVRTHRCSLCSKTFPSGQALGGHKRLHYGGGSRGSGAASEATSEASTSASVRGFDLNLPPPLEFGE